MIIDKLKNASFYYGINDKIKIGLEYLENTDLKNLENGKYEIDKDEIFALIQEYQSKSMSEGKWEAHQQYIDIQFIIEGEELLGYLNIDEFEPTSNYDKEKDIIWGNGNGNFAKAKEGEFLIFTSKDAHMPGIAVDKPSYVKKAVIKVKVL
ncbi:MAG: YhcH/YjgK/YiaL family protein [Candidatus Gastranaerophilales bacterium]|nr:YhcH/YjgK/YiaL family protein [Candidatus Gastranaerophilales bacterium]